MFNKFFILTILLSINSNAIHANSMSPNSRGLEIAMEQVGYDTGWNDAETTLEMILQSPNGNTSRREIVMKLLEVNNDGDKSLLTVQTPKDVKGTNFLTHSKIDDADKQWIYLPALKRVKRIASKNKSGPFMGSEFSYEDMSSFEYQDFDFKYIRDDNFDGFDCFLVEQTPKDKYSGYSKRIVWVDKQAYRTIKMEFYDRKGDLLKTLHNTSFKQYLQKYWRPGMSSIVNHQTGKSTDLVWGSYSFQIGLEQRDFYKNSLKRAR